MVVALVRCNLSNLLIEVPKFAALVKLLATTYKTILFRKIVDFYSSFSYFFTSREEPLTVTCGLLRNTFQQSFSCKIPCYRNTCYINYTLKSVLQFIKGSVNISRASSSRKSKLI